MATSDIFYNYVMDHLSKIGNFTCRKMMGEYLVYMNGKLVGEICDNTLLVKPTKTILSLLPNSPKQYPYEGSKTLMVVIEDIDNEDLLKNVFETLYIELPTKK